MTKTDYDRAIERIALKSEGDMVLGLLDNGIGWWVKDMDFMFINISELACNHLYGPDNGSDVALGKTDYEMAKISGMDMGLEQFASVCRASDLYVLEQNKKGNNGWFYFVEFLNNTEGKKMIWLTKKGIQPIKGENKKYFVGFADFKDEQLGSYENALSWFKNLKNTTKLNDNLYLLNNY